MSHEIPVDPIIGYFDPHSTNLKLVCYDCVTRVVTDGMIATRVYQSNIVPYGQTCHECGKILVKACEGWPELFTKPVPASETP